MNSSNLGFIKVNPLLCVIIVIICSIMSVTSRRTKSSTPTSILKKSVSFKCKLNNSTKSVPKVTFALPQSEKLNSILQEFSSKKNIRDYEHLVCLLRDCDLSDKDFCAIVKEANDSIPLLNQDLRLFVEALLMLKWLHRSKQIVTEYQSLLVNLTSAHNYHAKMIIDTLVSKFLPEPEEPEWPNGVPPKADCKKCDKVHRVLKTLLKVVPMCKDLLLKSLVTQYPYFKKSTHFHELYLYNLLRIVNYEPTLRYDILHLIFSRLIVLDVNAPREEIEYVENDMDMEGVFAMDEDDLSGNYETTRHPVGHTLDVCMERMFEYVITECHDPNTNEFLWENTKSLYHDMITVFDKVILPTYNTHHVQFIMFCMCSFKSTIVEAFLNYLWKKVCSPSVPSVHRQSAIAYFSSLIARGGFVPIKMLKGALQQMANWIHAYISTQDGLECVNSDVRVHAVFYAVCQGLFYVIAFRHFDLLSTKKNVTFLESLNLPKMVTCRLNPLRVCQPAVIQNFAAVTRTYQLAYCYSVMEHNARNVLPTIYQDDRGGMIVSSSTIEALFPFDPYILRRSSEKIQSYYLNYQEFNEEEQEYREMGEDDDFLGEASPNAHMVSRNDRFSYGSSPGFKGKI